MLAIFLAVLGIPTLDLFWTVDTSVLKVVVRDIYVFEFLIFEELIFSFSGTSP